MLRRRRKNLLYLGNALQLKLVRNVYRVRADGPRPGGREDDSYDPCRAEIRIAQGPEGRLASVGAELLTALPSGCPPSRAAPRPATLASVWIVREGENYEQQE